MLAYSIDYAARRVGAADLGYREVYERGGQGRGRACGAAAPCNRATVPARWPPGTGGGMRRGGPLRRGGIAGQGDEEDGPQRTPCAGGRAADGTAPPRGEGAAGWVGGSGVPARSRTRTLQDPGQFALRRLQNVTPRNAARGTQKSSLRLGIGSYGSGERLAAGHLVRLGAWARPGWRGRGGGGRPTQFTAGQRAEPARGRRGAPSGPSGPRLPPPSDPVKQHLVPYPLTAWCYRRRRALACVLSTCECPHCILE